MNYDIIEATSVEEVLSEIEENSKYKWIPPKEKTWMTVPEMGNLLGLKKTIVVQLSSQKSKLFIMN